MVVQAYAVCIGVTLECRRMELEMVRGMRTRWMRHTMTGLRGHTHGFTQKETSPSMGHGMVRVGPRKASVSPKGNIEGVFTGSPAVVVWRANIKSAGVVEVGWAYSVTSMAP